MEMETQTHVQQVETAMILQDRPGIMDFILCDLIPGRLSFAIHEDEAQTVRCIQNYPNRFYFSSNHHEAYASFLADFGPVNIAEVVQFCEFVRGKMLDPRIANRHLVFYCDADQADVTNAAFLLGAFLILCENRSPESAVSCFSELRSSWTIPFRDASTKSSTFDLSILDCLHGVQRAWKAGIFNPSSFNIEEYLTLDDPSLADLHVMCEKLVAMRSPMDVQQDDFSSSPGHYIPIFQHLDVSTVVRLNDPSCYDKKAFEDAGLKHHDLELKDETPSMEDVEQFFEICDKARGKVVVHCEFGLGRTGTMIGAWMMREYGFTAREVIAWVRLVRPGSVIGGQQHFLVAFEEELKKQGMQAEQV